MADELKTMAQRGRPIKRKKKLKPKQAVDDMADGPQRFQAFDLAIGMSASEATVRIGGMLLCQIVGEAVGHRLNSAEQERLGKLLVAAEAVRKLQGPSGGTRRRSLSMKPLSPAEFKEAVGYKYDLTNITYWCRIKLLKAHKLDPDNPKSEWRIDADEVNRYIREGGISVPSNMGKNAERKARDRSR